MNYCPKDAIYDFANKDKRQCLPTSRKRLQTYLDPSPEPFIFGKNSTRKSMAKHTFVISDESVLNSHGFRVMTDGINLANYEKNPLVLWWHKRPNPWEGRNGEDEVLPIGKASNLRKEGTQLLADIEFDQDDDFARKIEKKVDNDFIRMCSPGLDPVTISEDEEYLLPGQKYATLVESDLVEISIADIGSNPNALKVKLYNSNKELVTLSRDDDSPIIPLVSKSQNSNNKSMEFIKRVATTLALNPDASEKSVMDTLSERLELANRADSLKTENDTLKEQIRLSNERQIISLVDANVDKKFTADKRDQLIKLGKDSGYDTLKDVIDLMPEQQKPTDRVNLTNNGGGQTKVENFEELLKLGREEVEKFRKDNREEYVKLFKAHYGVEPDFRGAE